VPYSACMWALFLDEPERRPGHCSKCEHSEFVHDDHGARGCLYSNCECVRFQEVVGRLVSLPEIGHVAPLTDL
jgi:hypothetical protein